MSESFAATCPTCRAEYRIPGKYAGKAVKCKKCGGVIPSPERQVSPAQPPLAPPIVAKAVTSKPPSAKPVATRPAVYRPPAVTVDPPQLIVPPLEPSVTGRSTPKSRRNRTPRIVMMGLVLAAVAGTVAVGAVLLGDQSGDRPTAMTAPTAALIPDPPPLVEPPVPEPPPPAIYPRRMLVMSISRYLYCNGLTAGTPSKKANGDRVTEVADRLAFDWHIPTDPDNNQLYILSDTTGRTPRPMIGPIVRAGYESFFSTCRPQDHVIVYFGGHAVEVDGKAYLVPTDGDRLDPVTLIPLADFYAKLQACPAHQRVVVFDVCRINESGDQVRPGSEPMTSTLEAALLAAPPGVQVVLSCSAGQQALEFRQPPADAPEVAGSLFLASLRTAVTPRQGTQWPKPGDPFPVSSWEAPLKARMAELAALVGHPAPVPKFAGRDPSQIELPDDMPPAKSMVMPNAPKGVRPADVKKLIAAVELPPLRPGEALVEEPIESVVPFRAEALKAFQPDLVTATIIKKEPEKYPARAAALEALDMIRTQWGKSGKNIMDRFDGSTTEAVKKSVRARQEAPARIILELEERSRLMETLRDQAESESSQYWRITFLYALAEVKARLAFMHEYNNALAAIMTDNLPDQDPKKHSGLQLVSSEKMKSKRDVKEIGDAARELYDTIINDAPGTPWAVLARRAKSTALGLAWQPLPKPTLTKED